MIAKRLLVRITVLVYMCSIYSSVTAGAEEANLVPTIERPTRTLGSLHQASAPITGTVPEEGENVSFAAANAYSPPSWATVVFWINMQHKGTYGNQIYSFMWGHEWGNYGYSFGHEMGCTHFTFGDDVVFNQFYLQRGRCSVWTNPFREGDLAQEHVGPVRIYDWPPDTKVVGIWCS